MSDRKKFFMVRVEFIHSGFRNDLVEGEIDDATHHAVAMRDRWNVEDAKVIEGPLFLNDDEVIEMSR